MIEKITLVRDTENEKHMEPTYEMTYVMSGEKPKRVVLTENFYRDSKPLDFDRIKELILYIESL